MSRANKLPAEQTIVIKGNNVLWSSESIKGNPPKQWVLGKKDITQAFLTGKHPFTKDTIPKYLEQKVAFIVKTMGGDWWFSKLEKIKKYKSVNVNDIPGSAKVLGTGRYGTVYDYQGYAVKVADHRVYDGIPKLDGSSEAKCYKLLWDHVSLNYLSPCIGYLYQFTPGAKSDSLVFEKADKTLWSFLDAGKLDTTAIKSIIVQIIHALAVLQREFPGFRHNDLKTDNVLLDLTPRTQDITLKFEFPTSKAGGSEKKKVIYYKIPKSVPMAKISDLDFCNIPKKVENPKVGTEFAIGFGCTRAKNDIYDLHLFLNSIYSHKAKLPQDLRKWLMSVLPPGTRGSKNKNLAYSRLIHPEKWTTVPTPIELLECDFLKDQRNSSPTWPAF